MNSIPRPSRARRSANNASICACTDTSSADTGSSATMNSGSVERPRDADALSLAACRIRADSGRACFCVSPTCARNCRRHAPAARDRGTMPVNRQPIGDLVAHAAGVGRGCDSGSENELHAPPRPAARSPPPPAISAPSNSTPPALGASNPNISRPIVPLTGAAFAHQPDRLAAPDRRANVGHRLHRPRPRRTGHGRKRRVTPRRQRRHCRPPRRDARASSCQRMHRVRRPLPAWASAGRAASHAALRMGAARCEQAARRQVMRRRHGPRHGFAACRRHPPAQPRSKAAVYGCSGLRKIAATLPFLDDLAGIHHRRPGQRSPATTGRLWVMKTSPMRCSRFSVASNPAPAPGWLRPAPWSVRRQSAGADGWRSPWRSSRAGACRRTVSCGKA